MLEAQGAKRSSTDGHTLVSFASVAALGLGHSPLSSPLLLPHVQRHCREWKNDMCSPLCGPSSDCMAISGRTKVRGWSVVNELCL